VDARLPQRERSVNGTERVNAVRMLADDMDASTVALGAFGLGAAAVLGWITGALGTRAKLADERRRSSAADAELERRETAERDRGAVQDLILGSMQEGVLLFDSSLETAFANDALQRHLGSRPGSVGQLFPPDLREAVRRVATSSQTLTLEVERSAPTRWLRVTAAPAGEGAVLIVVTDVTDARRLETVRRDFVANASHELKTPAASIQAAAETLRAVLDDDPEAVARFATQLEREARRLSRIVADLLDLSRLESGSELSERVRVDAIVREEAERFDDAQGEAGVSISVRAPQPATVAGSARDLSLLVRNLIDNAVRYTPPGGTVDIEVDANDGEVTLSVRDTGVGIPARDLPRVFERFYRVDRARSRGTGGTGLGLSIVRHVAENHGGSVEVSSELGTGSTFTVRLPTRA
jgi:two-component system sensor histidine kinase SenX3